MLNTVPEYKKLKLCDTDACERMSFAIAHALMCGS